MKKCELLSPAGNMEMLKYAIMYGADAVYLAGSKFGARKFANNFTLEELDEAIKFAHLYGVKVYVTINTLIYENEIDEFLDYVKYIHSCGVDAVLVQDFGMLDLLHHKFPDLTLHASTQMHNNSKDMLSLLKRYGVKRVVLDREMSLNEIKKLNVDIEKEVFCHGALCVSYSGQCLFSSMVLNRSGNRGECAGMCRLKYKLEKDGKMLKNEAAYYLSMKDLCTANHIGEILASGVDSLKIEGRMKSKEYVGYITKIYRDLIDSYYQGEPKKISGEELKNMKLLFNRGLTKGFINDESSSNIVNIESPNHIGIHLGTYKISNKQISLILEEDLNQNDVIRFVEENKAMTVNFLYDKNHKLINCAKKGSTVFVDNFLELTKNGEVRKVGSYLLNEEIHALPKRKVHIDAKISIKSGQKIKIEVSDGINKLSFENGYPDKAKTRPINKEDIIKQIKKTGNTIYEIDKLDIDLGDGLFINLKDLNEMRRDVLTKLDNVRMSNKTGIKERDYESTLKTDNRSITVNVKVETKMQYEAARQYACNIFTENLELYHSLKNEIYPVIKEGFQIPNFSKYMICDYGALVNIKESAIVHSDYMLNVTNSYSVNNLINLNVNTICLSPEFKTDQIIDLVNSYNSSYIEVLLYGKIELMKMKYDLNSDNSNTSLIDRNNKKYFIKRVKDIYYLMSSDNVDLVNDALKFKEAGVKNFRLDFYDETYEECDRVLKKLCNKI